MATQISSIRNLGPAMEAAFARAGVPDAETLRGLGPDAAYAKLLQAGERAHFIAYYVLVMALQGRPWNDCQGDEKAALRKRFEALKASSVVRPGTDGPVGIEGILDELGVIEAPRSAPPLPRG